MGLNARLGVAGTFSTGHGYVCTLVGAKVQSTSQSSVESDCVPRHFLNCQEGVCYGQMQSCWEVQGSYNQTIPAIPALKAHKEPGPLYLTA